MINEMILNSVTVQGLATKCMFKEGSDTTSGTLIQSVGIKIVFDPVRLKSEKNQEELDTYIDDLPDEFRLPHGSPFVNMVVDKVYRQWGEQRDASILLAMGIASGKMEIITPKSKWSKTATGTPDVRIL